jgi:hypothetical protein
MINPEAQKLRDAILASTALVRTQLADIDANALMLAALVPDVPDPPPPPPPPPPVGEVEFFKRSINATRELAFSPWYPLFERYARAVAHVRVDTKPVEIKFGVTDRAAGGVAVAFAAPEYSITLNGIEIARVKPTGRPASFVIDPAKLPPEIEDGYCQLDAIAMDGNGNPAIMQIETPVPFWIVINRNGKAKNAPFFVAQDSSFDIFRGGFVFHWAKIPRRFIFNDDGTFRKPRAYPLKDDGPAPEWTTMQPLTNFTAIQLSPYIKNDHYTLTADAAGVPTFASHHVYAFEDFENNDYWMHPSTSGARNVGNVIMPTDPQSSRLGGAHFLEHSRFGHCKADGTVIPHLGWDYDFPAPPWNDRAECLRRRKLIGDWSEVPEDKRGLDRSWSWCWVMETLRTDESAEPIPNNNTLEKPHLKGPTALIARQMHNDVLAGIYDPRSHETPTKARIVISGLNKPWAVCEHNGIVLVTEQGANRISAYQYSETGEYPKLWEIPLWFTPQGMDHDGQGNFLVACMFTKTVYSFTLDEKTIRAKAVFQTTAKTKYAGVKVNKDPKTGPVGWFAVTNFAETVNFGHPECFLPETTIEAPKKCGPFPWSYVPTGINGGAAGTYSMPAGMGWGFMVEGGSDVGLTKWRLKKAGDVKFDHNQFNADAGEWHSRGFHLVYGPTAFPKIDIDLPWGVSPATDRYIKVCHAFGA